MKEDNTLFDDLIKNLENNKEVYEFIKSIIYMDSEEKRLDVVVNYNKMKYIIELKIWNGLKYHEKGIKQLCDYLDIHGLDKGYLGIFNFNKNKEYKEEIIRDHDKEILGIFV